MKIFEENDYNFTDSILDAIKLDDKNINDYLVEIDYYCGKQGSIPLRLKLKNVKALTLSLRKEIEMQLISLHTLAYISKKKKDGLIELEIFSAMNYFSNHKGDAPLLYCLCEEVYVESKNS